LSRLYIALPVINENDCLPRLINCISGQTYRDFELFVCVNQPDDWWDDSGNANICHENLKTLDYLNSIRGIRMVVVDKCSKGKGWTGKRHGVGWARKTLMDAIISIANDNDIIISVDADTTFSKNYFQSIADTFIRFPEATGLVVPYFHKPVNDENAYRAILRYEIYMRHYSINLWRIGSPYTFTALGSAMACPIWAYRLIGGMTPKMSGEDFYFLQKLRKTGRLIFWNPEKVYPEARFSDRVYFGTGPAMIKGNQGDWSSYPIYRWRFFDEIKETYDLFPAFFGQTRATKVTDFLRLQFREDDPFEPLRKNSANVNQFIRACHEKFDGLRILQYLKSRQKEEPLEDEKSLNDFLNWFYPETACEEKFSFEHSSSDELENIRMFLFRKEEEYQVNSIHG
jgi:glycosyltransferase involved in cell wall biosynthesis